MSTNIVIGVGGTGAKVVEAILHVGAAGLTPSNLMVGFVDQDQSNGNVSRAMESFEAIRKARAAWRTSGSNHFVANGGLLPTSVSYLGDGLWTPHPEARASLAQILGDLRDDKTAFDLLFEQGQTEQDMRLDEGYRGRAHIGSAAITSAVLDGSEFWDDLREKIRSAKGGEEVRIILAGSVFGGTGAAGFPTLSRLIRRIIDESRISANIKMGGILMLPYFKFSPPADENANVARTEDLLPQTRGALRYYASLFRREKVFDEMFTVGWNPGFDLGYHEPGTGDQRNPALVPELIAALGASRFLQPGHTPSEKVMLIARQNEDAVVWSDLPEPQTSDSDAAYEFLGQQLRFFGEWKLWRPILGRQADHWTDNYVHHAWFRKQELNRIDFKNQPPSDALEAMDAYVDAAIEWFATMKAYADRQQMNWGLWNTDPLVDGAVNFESPTRPITPHTSLTDQELLDGFERLVQPLESASALPTSAEIHYRMNTEAVSGEHEGLGRFVASLHDFCGPRFAKGAH